MAACIRIANLCARTPLLLILVCASCYVVCANDQRTVITYNLTEEEPKGTVVGNVKQDAGLSRQYGRSILDTINFQILSQPVEGQDFFMLEERTGAIKTNLKIDRESICAGKVSCEVKLDIVMKSQKHQIFSFMKVNINIIDINDNYPIFPQREIGLTILESSAVGTGFLLPSAVDKDSPALGVQHYRLSSDAGGRFDIKVKSNLDGSKDVHLIIKQTLDREAKDSYFLNVFALDGGTPQRSGKLILSISVLDANDNSPRFLNSTYREDILENMPANTPVLRVTAVDPDHGHFGRVEYGFSGRTERSYGDKFGIRQTTGEIYTKRPLDYEDKHEYHLRVMARDKGPDSIPSYTTVIINVVDVNDYTPMITFSALTGSDVAEVPEGTNPGAFVAHITVVDKDSGKNGETTCSLNNNNFRLEKIEPTGYQVLTVTQLDREKRESYGLRIHCADRGVPPRSFSVWFEVKVTDINDHSPEFTKEHYQFDVHENSRPNTTIGSVYALDRDHGENQQIVFSIQGTSASLFAINSQTGEIKLRKPIDREKTDSITFSVIASDSGSPPRKTEAHVTLTILDINDVVPTFTQEHYQFYVLEKESAPVIVGQVAARDNDTTPYSKIYYSLLPKNKANTTFSVNLLSGQIKTRKTLIKDEQSTYVLLIRAGNKPDGSPAGTATVTVVVTNISFHSPTFLFPTKDNNTVFLPRIIHKGQKIADLLAQQKFSSNPSSSGRLEYFMTKGDLYGFLVDAKTGSVYAARDISVDRNTEFKLTVAVRDSRDGAQVVYEDLVIVLNASIAAATGQLQQPHIGLSTQNLIILVCVMGFSVILAIALIVAIFLLRRQERKDKGHTYNCRIETLKALSRKKEEGDTTVASNEYINGTCVSQGNVTTKPKKEVSFSLDQQSGLDQSLEKSRQSLSSVIDHQSLQCPRASSSMITVNTDCGPTGHRYPIPEEREMDCISSGKRRDMEVKELMNMLRKDQDADSSCSNTDSGRGASEEGEMGSRTNSATHGIESHEVPHGGADSSFGSAQVVPEQSFFSNASSYGNMTSFHGSRGSGTSPSYIHKHKLSSRQRDSYFDSGYTDLGGSFIPMQVHRSQWSEVTPEGRLHPALLRKRQYLARGGTQVRDSGGSMETNLTNLTEETDCGGEYSCADISGVLEETPATPVQVRLQPVITRTQVAPSDCVPDDDSSTSGSYVVNPQELVQEINDLFFKDMVV